MIEANRKVRTWLEDSEQPEKKDAILTRTEIPGRVDAVVGADLCVCPDMGDGTEGGRTRRSAPTITATPR